MKSFCLLKGVRGVFGRRLQGWRFLGVGVAVMVLGSGVALADPTYLPPLPNVYTPAPPIVRAKAAIGVAELAASKALAPVAIQLTLRPPVFEVSPAVPVAAPLDLSRPWILFPDPRPDLARPTLTTDPTAGFTASAPFEVYVPISTSATPYVPAFIPTPVAAASTVTAPAQAEAPLTIAPGVVGR